jgi:hypothetical protein
MVNVETNETVAAVAEQGATAAPAPAAAKKATRRQKREPKGQKRGRGAKSQKAPKAGKKSQATARRESKSAKILELIGRSKGATLAEIMSATGWQAHSVRGFISTAGKRHGVQIDSSKNEAGERVYRTTK